VRTLREALERDGYAIVADVIAADRIGLILRAIERAIDPAKAGRRDLAATIPEIEALAAEPALRQLANVVLGREAFVVRTLFFDKNADANWKVAWHQDQTIAVREQRAVPGFGPWSVKDGRPHVQPPDEILEQMVTLRLHLDDCPETNGPLRVLPGSHRTGKLPPAAIADRQKSTPEVVCVLPAGGVLLMKPLLLHASSAALEPRHRRVVHLEFAAEKLPGGLEWSASDAT